MLNATSTIAATLLVTAVAGNAPAATLLDFTGSSAADATQRQFTVAGLTVTVTGGGTGGTAPRVTQSTAGLGVNDADASSFMGYTFGDVVGAINSVSPGEGVVSNDYDNFIDLTFSEQVRFDGLTLGDFDGGDDYGVAVDGQALTGANELAFPSLTFASITDLTGRTGTTLRIFTSSNPAGFGFPTATPADSDAFRLASLTVSAVPEPTTAGLLLIGGGLLPGRRRSRQAPTA